MAISIGEAQAFHRAAQPLGNKQRLFQAGARQQQCEFLAAIACRKIRFASGDLGKRLADAAQAMVAFDMAVTVVEQLEVIDVNHQQRDRPPQLRRKLPFRLQPRVESAPVGKAGKPVTGGELRQMQVGRANPRSRSASFCAMSSKATASD